MLASAARRAAAKRIEFLLSTFPCNFIFVPSFRLFSLLPSRPWFELLHNVSLLLYGIVHIVNRHPGIGVPVFPDVPKSWKGQVIGRDNIALSRRILKKPSSRHGGGRGVGIEAKRNVRIVHLQSDVDDVAPEHYLFSAVFKNINGQASGVAVSRLGPESGEELRGPFERLELSAVHVRLDLRLDLGKKSLLRLDCGRCNRPV